MKEALIEDIVSSMCVSLTKARRPVRQTWWEMRHMARAALATVEAARGAPPASSLSPYGDLCPPQPAPSTLRDDLVAAGVGSWRGALGADRRPLSTGMLGELAENVMIAGDYLPVRLLVGTPIRVDGIFFDKREDWCVVELIYPHTTGLRRARVRCNAVRG